MESVMQRGTGTKKKRKQHHPHDQTAQQYLGRPFQSCSLQLQKQYYGIIGILMNASKIPKILSQLRPKRLKSASPNIAFVFVRSALGPPPIGRFLAHEIAAGE